MSSRFEKWRILGESFSNPDAVSRSAQTAQRFVTVKRNVQLPAKIHIFGALPSKGLARSEGDWPGEMAERAASVRYAQARRVQQRLALKLPPGSFVKQRVKELNFVRRRADHLEKISEHVFGQR